MEFHKKLRVAKVAIIAILLSISPPPSFADGGRRLPYVANVGDPYISIFYSQPGMQMLIYPYYLKSNSLWDSNGKEMDIRVDAEGMLFRPVYSIKPNEKLTMFINGIVSTERVTIRNPATGKRETSSGLGDMVLAPSTFYKLDEGRRLGIYADMLMYFPTGDYKKGRLANVGTKQFSVEPMVFLAKGWRLGHKELYAEVGVNYLHNRENKDEHFRPGDMRQVQANLALMTGPFTMALTGRRAESAKEDKLFDQKVQNSKVRIAELGAVVVYHDPGNKYNAYFKVMQGIDGENTLKATTFLGKIWFPFY